MGISLTILADGIFLFFSSNITFVSLGSSVLVDVSIVQFWALDSFFVPNFLTALHPPPPVKTESYRWIREVW